MTHEISFEELTPNQNFGVPISMYTTDITTLHAFKHSKKSCPRIYSALALIRDHGIAYYFLPSYFLGVMLYTKNHVTPGSER